MQWLNDHKFKSESHPLDWFMTLMKTRRKRASDSKRSVFESWTSRSNAKVILANCSVCGDIYPT